MANTVITENTRANRRTLRSSARLADWLRYRIGGIGWVGGREAPQFLRVLRLRTVLRLRGWRLCVLRVLRTLLERLRVPPSTSFGPFLFVELLVLARGAGGAGAFIGTFIEAVADALELAK